MTSIAHPDYPGLVEFPLADGMTKFPKGYFNNTAAYAVAYALYVGAKKISLWGCDFTYPNAHDAEKGRACVEYWLGMAAAKGIEIATPNSSSLLDALHPQAQRFYGYDCVDLDFSRNEAGSIVVGMTPKQKLPTAEEIEHAYDHSRHPNPLAEASS
jgi:hypothetical protein